MWKKFGSYLYKLSGSACFKVILTESYIILKQKNKNVNISINYYI
jgi:hypothetical protein